MGWICSIFGHKWDGCICKKCGELNNAVKHVDAEHSWNGCTCVKCGRNSNTNHLYVNAPDSCETVCSVCGKAGEKQHMRHIWDGGKCARCGLIKENYELTLKVSATLDKMGMTFSDYARTGFLDAGRYGVQKEIQAIRDEYGQAGIDQLLETIHAEGDDYKSFISFAKDTWTDITDTTASRA